MYKIMITHNWNGQRAVRWGDVLFPTCNHAQEIANDLNRLSGSLIYTIKHTNQ